jgi:hypothetical protein
MPVEPSHRNAGVLAMGFSLKRLVKKAVKLGSKLATPILAATPVGAIALRAQQTLKSLGGNLKAARLGKIEPLSVRASIEKVAPRQAKILKLPSSIRPKGGSGRRRTSGRGSRMPQNRGTAVSKGKRVPPKGGLDLKAMAAAWRAAGKPGTWIGWIKSNQIKKAG